jgi:hypothetical protein
MVMVLGGGDGRGGDDTGDGDAVMVMMGMILLPSQWPSIVMGWWWCCIQILHIYVIYYG